VSYQRPSDDLKALENTLSNLESYLDMNPNETSLVTSLNSCNLTNCCPSDGDTLSDFDLEHFNSSLPRQQKEEDQQQQQQLSISSAIRDRVETTSISDFHNVRDVLMSIRERLDSCLKVPNESEKQSRHLELNIADLKRDLDIYVQVLNEKKENELRKFSENMINRQSIVQMKKAFSRKERFSKHIYETLRPVRNQLAVPMDEFTLRRCYNVDSELSCCDCSEINSVEYYSMLINEDVGEKSLHGAPHSSFYREKISLVNFRDPINVIRQWQDYQIKTVRAKSKSKSKFKLRWQKTDKKKPPVFGFTLDYHQTKLLQQKMEKERRIRLVCRMIFYFFSIVCFILIVVIVQSVFNFNKKKFTT
jgi:hypothetical protein